jgi:hypothetical protein
MHTEIQVLRCPDCGAKVSEVVRHGGFRAGGSSIGPSTIHCAGCGAALLTGQSEWGEKTILQQSWYIVQRVIWLIVASLLLVAPVVAIGVWAAVNNRFLDPSQQGLAIGAGYTIGTAIVGIILFRNAAKEIRESRQRTSNIEAASV